MSGSVLLVEVPEADPVVHVHRLELDPVARLGVPAHVTALFPFVPATDLGPDVLAVVSQVVARHRPFEATFSATAWFGEDVVYLAADDPGPFLRLTLDLAAAFPDHPPYGGQFPEPTPHLTVGQGDDLDALRRAERSVLGALPVTTRVERLSLLVEGDDGHWSRSTTFALDGSR